MKNVFLGVLATSALAGLILLLSFFQSERNTAEMKVQEAEEAVEWQEGKDDWKDAWNGISNDPEDRSRLLKKRNERLDGLKAEAEKAKVKRDHLDNYLDKAANEMESALEEESLNLEGLKKKTKKENARAPNPMIDDLDVQ
ncbi:MAG: hypothetical protein PHP57_06400 [Sideroxydans sp.]|nr:hypothetical protein [Sideroxydans sp.]